MLNYNIVIKFIEFVLSTTCMVVNFITNAEAFRLFLYYHKVQKDWHFMKNLTWDKTGDAVSHTVYGAYSLITLGLLIGRVFEKCTRNTQRTIEVFFYIVGVIAFIALGGLELSALDAVPMELVDNAVLMGGLSIITAVIFLVDLIGCNSYKKYSEPSKYNLRNNDVQECENDRNGCDKAKIIKIEQLKENALPSTSNESTLEAKISPNSSSYMQYKKTWMQQLRQK